MNVLPEAVRQKLAIIVAHDFAVRRVIPSVFLKLRVITELRRRDAIFKVDEQQGRIVLGVKGQARNKDWKEANERVRLMLGYVGRLQLPTSEKKYGHKRSISLGSI